MDDDKIAEKVIEDKHRLLLEALRTRESEILKFLVIFGPRPGRLCVVWQEIMQNPRGRKQNFKEINRPYAGTAISVVKYDENSRVLEEMREVRIPDGTLEQEEYDPLIG